MIEEAMVSKAGYAPDPGRMKPEVEGALEELFRELEGLADVSANVHERLHSVLRPDTPSSVNAVPDAAPSGVPLADQLVHGAEKVAMVRRRLQDIQGRLAI